ncbi:MAG: ATP12 family protein [Pseudomonadota bacterium]
MNWVPKRFWTAATAEAVAGGFSVRLDGRSVKTPAKSDFILPTLAMAEAAAAEWQAQDEVIDPATMPVTRSANAAIDKVAVQFDEVAKMLADYGDADLTCYRAAGPSGLVARQSAAWDPLLNWAADTYGARLLPVEGVMYAAQDPEALANLAQPLAAMTPFELTAMHDLVSLSGSLVIGLAAAAHLQPIDALWKTSRIDEDWQIEQWGEDEEASAHAQLKHKAFVHALFFHTLSHAKG